MNPSTALATASTPRMAGNCGGFLRRMWVTRGDEANGAEDFECADELDGSVLRVEAPGPSRDGGKAANPEYYL